MSDYKITAPHYSSTKNAMNILIVNLKILGRVEVGSKLISKGTYLIIDPIKWYQPIVRKLWHHEDRTYSYNKISNMVKEIYELLDDKKSYTYLRFTGENEMYNHLVPILERAKSGLINLKDTYQDDKTFSEQLDTEINNVHYIIVEIKKRCHYEDNNNSIENVHTDSVLIKERTQEEIYYSNNDNYNNKIDNDLDSQF